MEKIIKLMNEFCDVLIQIERNGITIDITALDNLEKEYRTEHEKLKEKLE